MANENNNPNQVSQQDGLQLRDILDLIWRLRYWIILSAIVAVVIGFWYARMQNPVYQRSTTIMLNNESSSGGELSAIADLMGGGSKKRIDNELFILKSSSMMQKVVEELDLNTRYYHYTMPVADRLNFGRKLFARKCTEYYKDNPYTLTFAVDSLYPAEMQPTSFSIDFRDRKFQGYTVKSVTLNGHKYSLEQSSYEYGQTVALPGGTFMICIDDSTDMRSRDRYMCSWTSPYNCAKGFAGKLKTSSSAIHPAS